ncbi:MAG TPA: DNA repair protein RecO [Bacilli bacterium]|nr:DNA repair protein RecO [Bacilli bacterium]
MLKDILGIVLKERDYGESSKILDVFTKEYGIIGVISKGSKKLKSTLSGVSTKLSYGVFHIYYKEQKLSTLTCVDITNPFFNIKKDILKVSFSTYLADLTYQIAKQSDDFNNIFDLLISALTKINDGYDPLVITNILELKYLDFLGVSPILDKCGVCGNSTNIVTISSDCNGLLCKNCRTTEKIYDLKVIKYIRMYYYLNIDNITKIDIDKNIKEDINNFLTEYYNKNTGIYLNSKKFIEELKKLNICN